MAAEILDNGDVVWYIRGVNLLWMDAGVIYDTPNITLYFHNAHGDVVGLVGSFSRNYSYDAFGNELDESGQPVSTVTSFGNWTSSDANSFRYCGEYFDDETGTTYLRARYYDPTVSRFTQEDTHWNLGNSIYGDNPRKMNENSDPLGLNLYTYVPDVTAMMQSGNLYVYGMSNPLMYVDPTGELSLSKVHNWVVKQIVADYEHIGMISDKMIVYSSGFGFADLISAVTGEVWEVKKSTVPMNLAMKQLYKYTPHRALLYPGLELYTGGSQGSYIRMTPPSMIRKDELYIYTIWYWDCGNGIIQYSFIREPNWENIITTVGVVAGAAIIGELGYVGSIGGGIGGGIGGKSIPGLTPALYFY